MTVSIVSYGSQMMTYVLCVDQLRRLLPVLHVRSTIVYNIAAVPATSYKHHTRCVMFLPLRDSERELPR